MATPFDSHREEVAAATECGCFRRLCFRWDTEHEVKESHSYLLREKELGEVSHKEECLVAKLKKLGEFSEHVTGPKWKNLIRKMGKICIPKKSKHPTVNFQYSPKSYALNFAGDDREDNLDLLQSFPMRLAPAFVINDHQTREPPSM